MSGDIPLQPPACFHGVERDDFTFLPHLCHLLQSLNQAPEIQHYLQHMVIFLHVPSTHCPQTVFTFYMILRIHSGNFF